VTPGVLYEDNHLLALDKPSGMPAAHFDGETGTADHWAKDYLRRKYRKPGNVFLGVVHRLDRPTSGVLLFARTSKAAARLSDQFRDGTARKVYLAVTTGCHWPDAGELRDWLLHDDPARRVRAVPPDTPGAKPAETAVRVLARDGGRTLLELRPATGRKHQLRVQLASRGGPIVGDAKYGSPVPLGDAIALHAKSLTVAHPTRGERLTFAAELPPHWPGPGVEHPI
jgi:23S rRNA pseudouridine1911/1915/1917 synthase